MNKERWNVHEAHCCPKCGCKYGYDDCPVVSGETQALYDCMDCLDNKDRVILSLQQMGKRNWNLS